MSLSPQRVDFDSMWANLKEAVADVVTLTGRKAMPMMEDIYKLCTAQPHPYSEELYNHLKEFLESHVSSLYETIVKVSDILVEYEKKWDDYSTGTTYIHHIFRYLNHNWIRKRLEDSRNRLGGLYQNNSSTSEVYEVLTLALVIWKEKMFVPLQDTTLRGVLALLTKERDSEMVNSQLIKGIITSYVKLGGINKNRPLEIYKDYFEEPFIANTKEYYATESIGFIASNGVSSYMKKAKERIEEEEARAKKYLDSSSYDRVRKEVDSVLIEKHKDRLQVECGSYLQEEKMEDLGRMYHLLSRVEGGINPMLEELGNHVKKVGLDAIKSVPGEGGKVDEVKYITTILEVYHKFNDLVTKAFETDPAFVAALDKAMRFVVNNNPVNKNTTKTPELLAKYSDFLLSKKNRDFNFDNLEKILQQVLIVFKYVDDKDVFQKFYSKMLAKRLINGTSVAEDAESGMIGGLKQACGYEYTSKLQRMFVDVSASNDINERFKTYIETNALSVKVDCSFMILTQMSWPLSGQSSANFKIPQEVEQCVSVFTKFYTENHSGRKLSWLHLLGKGDLKSFYLPKKYEFAVSSHQMAVLLMFNKFESMTLADITTNAGLSPAELQRVIVSLCATKILKKTPASKQCKAEDVVELNMAFKSQRLKVQPVTAVQKETKESNAETYKSLNEDRALFLQAAIVRIMKMRKKLMHSHLITETIQQAKSRFQPDVHMIKKCIEQLIEKEYLERVEGEKDTYAYVA